MKKELMYWAVFVGGAALLFACSMLLDLYWVQARIVRQVIVYAVMAVIAWVIWKNLKTS